MEIPQGAPQVNIGLYTHEELSRFADYARCPSPESRIERGLHYDDGKARYDLIPVEAIELEAKVMAYGASKYSDHNWRKGIRWGRLFASTLRHLYSWWRGNDLDKESGLSHLAHARCCLGMLIGLSARKDLDDRNKD